MINEEIENKKKEIEEYKGVLKRYGSGRWLDQGLRRLAQLEQELEELIERQE